MNKSFCLKHVTQKSATFLKVLPGSLLYPAVNFVRWLTWKLLCVFGPEALPAAKAEPQAATTSPCELPTFAESIFLTAAQSTGLEQYVLFWELRWVINRNLTEMPLLQIASVENSEKHSTTQISTSCVDRSILLALNVEKEAPFTFNHYGMRWGYYIAEDEKNRQLCEAEISKDLFETMHEGMLMGPRQQELYAIRPGLFVRLEIRSFTTGRLSGHLEITAWGAPGRSAEMNAILGVTIIPHCWPLKKYSIAGAPGSKLLALCRFFFGKNEAAVKAGSNTHNKDRKDLGYRRSHCWYSFMEPNEKFTFCF